MNEPSSGSQSAQGEGIAQALGAGAIAIAGIHHHHHYPETLLASWNWPRPWDFSGYIREKRRAFVGRDWLIDEVRAWYEDGAGAQALLICADYGVGKSAFMAELTHNAPGLRIAAWHFCDHYVPATLNPAEFVRSVAAQLADSLPQYRSAVDANPDACRWLDDVHLDPASAFERAVVGPLNAITPPTAPLILIVDALDEALDVKVPASSSPLSTIVRLLAAQANHLPAWLRVLATSRRIQEVLQPMQNAFRCSTILDGEDARNLDDIRGYVAGRCARAPLAHVLEKGSRSAGDIAAFLSDAKQSGGKFLYAVRVLNDIESGALPLARLNDLPPGMDGFYLDAFERRFPAGKDYAPVGVLLGVLCVDREPLSRAELAAILCTTEAEVGTILRQLADFLRMRAKRYGFDHLSLAQWLSEADENDLPRAGWFSVDVNAAELLIAGWARRELAAGRAHESAYLARHLAAYLRPEQRKVHFARLLFNFRWLDARLRAAGINALLMDFADVDETPALNALERALRHSTHILGHDDSDWLGADLLASQILGRLQSRVEPEVHALCVQAAGQLARDAGLRPLTDSLRSVEALVRTLEGHTDWVTALAVLADGRLASGSADHTIRLWNLAIGVCEATLEGHTDTVGALVVLADGRLASGSLDHTIRLWNPASAACDATLEGHTGAVTALAVLADGRLASGSSDKTIRLWNAAGAECEATFRCRGATSSLAVLADGRLARGFSKIMVWNPANGACEATLGGHTDWVTALAVLGDGRLASGSSDKTIRLWNMPNGLCEATLVGHEFTVTALAVLADGRLVSGSGDNTIRVWNLASGVCEVTLSAHTSGVWALAALADGRLASGLDNEIKLWNPASGAGDPTVAGHRQRVSALAVLADGRLASGSWDDTIRLWDPASGVCESILEGQTDQVYALAALGDGRLASGSWDHMVRVWNPSSGVCESTFEGHTDEIIALAVLGDGRLASGSGAEGNTIKLWNPTSGVCEMTLEGHSYFVSALALLADGRLASGSGDATIRVWNPRSGVCEMALKGHSYTVSALAVLANGRLASASEDATIRLWNPASGVCEATFEGHADKVTALVTLADGRLVSGSADRTIRVWEVRDRNWTGSVLFIADAGISALAFEVRAGVLVAGDDSGRVHFLKMEAAGTFPA